MKNTKPFLLLLLMSLAWNSSSLAQWASHESVLSRHTWYKIGVTEDGVYGLDYATLNALGVDVQNLNPAKIRLFGNVPGVLPEENANERYDDLSEIAIHVTGADDGSFDAQDQVLFYGRGPMLMTLNELNYYQYERNPYTDTLYYFLCVDSGVDGLRIQDKPSAAINEETEVIQTFLDYVFHESDELSPYASGRTWYGDLFTAQEMYEEFTVDLPDLVTSEMVRVESKVLGRCKTPFTYNLKINDNIIVNNQNIKGYQDREYGEEHKAIKTFLSASDHLTLRYELNPTEANPMVFIDFFALNYWRELRFHGREMAFRLIPRQLLSRVSRVQMEGVGSGVTCWDVTDPLHPYRQELLEESGTTFFGVSIQEECFYHLFEPSGVKQVASCYPIPNQNLHAIADAEMLVITPKVFWNQSEALANFHREEDGMNCVLADVSEIYNEFGTGTSDPTAVRDFIRMVYQRSGGNLKYVLLMGKGTHDYRNIKGLDNNFVPTYETANSPYLEVYSMCSDDYFGLMDESEGFNCDGKVDLGIGRIPITTPEQGDAVIAKILHYSDLSYSNGIWKNNHLFVADNDSKFYPEYADKLDHVLDTAGRVAMTKKLYLDAYPIVSTPSGDRIPLANQTLMDYFDKGVSVLSYIGHGGVKSLSAEWVLSVSDILALDNYDRLPFIHTATCEFSKFDNPNVVSGGELLLLNSHGGAIALLTTLRPTQSMTNQLLSVSLHDHIYDRVDQKPMRFGDIYREAKSDPHYYSKSNIVYALFGDPALRFSYPDRNIRTDKVNGETVGEGVMNVSEMGSIEGVVLDPDNKVDTKFNGILEYRVYDTKSNYTTLGNFGVPWDYSYYHDVLYEGKVSVVKGRFSFEFPVPTDVNHGSGTGCLSYYAYDSIRKVEANGVCEKLKFSSTDVSAQTDFDGPEIKMYWNSPVFVNGDVVARQGVLYADLFDEHGIYHYNVSIGRDIVLKSNLQGYDNMILNDVYEPSLDDYRRGRIALPMDGLEEGTYIFTLKAWDTQNNSSEVELTLVVARNTMMANVYNFPNPFKGETYFNFVNGDLTDNLFVVVEIFDVFGRHVAHFEKETASEGGVVPPIPWDGSALKAGLYVYKLTVTSSDGKSVSVSQRMMRQ